MIHIEQQWEENALTMEGHLQHRRVHNEDLIEKRGDLLVVRNLHVVSHRLRMSGYCDVVEFQRDANGVPINYCEGNWRPLPVEYKHGHEKTIDADRMQLCAQVMALEEMLVCQIDCGCIFYKETRQREYVEISRDLRKRTMKAADEMIQYFQRGYTPKVKMENKCKKCSLAELCLPKLSKKLSVEKYIEEMMKS